MFIEKLKNIAIFKSNKDGENQPSHYMKASMKGDKSISYIVGNMWTKTFDKEGEIQKYLSGSFQDEKEYNGKIYNGFVLVNERQLDRMVADYKKMYAELHPESPVQYPTPEELNIALDEVPF